MSSQTEIWSEPGKLEPTVVSGVLQGSAHGSAAQVCVAEPLQARGGTQEPVGCNMSTVTTQHCSAHVPRRARNWGRMHNYLHGEHEAI